MASVRPDVRFEILAVDRLVAEEPERVGSALRALLKRVASGELKPLPVTRWPLAEAGAALESMRAARHVGKIVLAPSALASGRLRGDRSYLVTGGLGGIGLEVAAWLAEAGAGAIVLNGRRAPEAGAEAAIGALRARGAEVRVEVADVTDEEAVAGMLSRVEAELPPLGGVIHSVGVLSDGALVNQDWGVSRRFCGRRFWGRGVFTGRRWIGIWSCSCCFRARRGSWGTRARRTTRRRTRFWTSWRGTVGALGLSGQAIAWGAWSRVGEAEKQRKRIAGRLTALGAGWITPQQGIRALSRLVREDAGTSVVASVDWSALPSSPVWLEEVVTREADEPGAASDDLSRLLSGLSATEREEGLIRFLQKELVSVLRLRSAPSPETGFFELGMDSLMAVELRNRLNRALPGGLVVSNTAVFDHPDAARLARHLAWSLGIRLWNVRFGRRRRLGVRRKIGSRSWGWRAGSPGGPDVSAFWDQLVSGGDAVTKGRPDRLFVDAATAAARFFGPTWRGWTVSTRSFPDRAGGGGTVGPSAADAAGDELGGAGGRGSGSGRVAGEPDRGVRRAHRQ